MVPDFPQEILIEIFSRLPTKSIGKLKCLSKTWRNLFSSRQFIKSHLAQDKARHEYVILIPPSHNIHSVEILKVRSTVSTKLFFPGLWREIVGSCNGLVLLLNDDDDHGEMLLANPITLQRAKIRNPPLAFRQGEGFTIYGFGHDRVRDDYKVVTLSFYSLRNEPDLGYTDIFVEVYSMKTGVWKRLRSPPNYSGYAYPYIPFGALVNGAIHWLAIRTRESGVVFVITAFDLVNETFFEIPPPVGVDVEVFSPDRLVVLGGCLYLVDTRSNVEWADLWVMKEYGVAESWTKFRVYGYGNSALFKPLCFVGDAYDEEIVSVVEGRGLVVYNVKEGKSRNLAVNGVRRKFVDGCTFVESLVSPAAL
ncbi:hypothetical protein CASFOL_030053 [Castilleja foliolosa]|uniref:F-box domain-containing protein n=1 Tax=Castilleja foliolosa TaxID=1961234 RepID=A0ABD3CA81_9LAMI